MSPFQSSPQNLIPTILLLSLLLLARTQTEPEPDPDSFLRCFLSKSPDNRHVIFPQNTTAYTALYQSSIQNNRFLHTPLTKPLLLVTPNTAHQIRHVIQCTRSHNGRLRARTRSGGHDYEGMSYVSDDDPFVLVDTSPLRAIQIDPNQSTAWVQSGSTLGELYHRIGTSDPTLAFPAGSCPTVGVGGHLSGGGIGVLSRKFGTAADNIVDAIVVNAEGEILDREGMGEDLFWAIRGGGAASFGIVVAYNVRLGTVPQVVTAFNVYRTANLSEIVAKWEEIGSEMDLDLYIRVLVQAVETVGGGRAVAAQFNALYLGPCDELESVMGRTFPELGFESKDCNEMSWLESCVFFAGYTNQSVDVLLNRRQFDISFKIKSDYVKRPIGVDGLDDIWRFLVESEDEPVILVLEPYGGRLGEIAETQIPFPHRAGNLYSIQYILAWNESESEERNLNWMRRLYEFMTPYVSSNPREAYLNYKDIDLGRTGVDTSYSEARIWGEKYFLGNFRRLALVKGRVDPGNFFRNEQSVPPLIVDNVSRQVKLERNV